MRTVVAIFVVSLALGGCASGQNSRTSAAGPSAESGWPREITHAAGKTTIKAKPVKIVSVAPSLTGTLLAIDAPVIGSAAASVTRLTDADGFFKQWSDIAKQRGVKVVYKNLQLDMDAIEAMEPDLIVGSVNGGDTMKESYAQLSEIAPTVLLDYGTMTWQDLTTALSTATGQEERAASVLNEYQGWIAEQAKKVKLPAQPVTAMVYLGADGAWAFTAASPQAALLKSLGFQYNDVPSELSGKQRGAQGAAVVSRENLAAAFSKTQTLLVVPIGPADVIAQIKSDPLLANQPAVRNNRVMSLGEPAFRLDYYSAKLTVAHLIKQFS